ncbi:MULTISPECIES: hypothetical protein [unclassified Polaribacter]|jgi:hypothetical protein|uniref:hypothetical protein n=1 Tax=unclassified Polaribacter TaxID=196858 RepID=UPI00052C9D37|nr:MULTISPECIES: hypothetical protein [unclassified Polaribacter]KGL60137.1 hypothetical protein PHEL49_1003 [Polaribacter sp. Hel1_33_49]PKV66146.1 hypothetical protein ATE90_2604 [Polaribacter sp. Hel1_33_96]
MKTLYSLTAFVLFISASLSFTSKINVKENTLTATFKGLTIDDYFKFEDDNNKIFLFYDIKEDIDINLYDDELIDKKFTLTWSEIEIELTDENGDLTGEKKKGKYIIELTLAK